MLNEPADLTTGRIGPAAALVQPTQQHGYEPLQTAVAQVMQIEQTEYEPNPSISVSFTGRLIQNSETAYDIVDQAFAPLDYHAILSTNDTGQQVFMAYKGRIHPKPRPWWPNLLLLVLTLFSLLMAGTLHELGMQGATEISWSKIFSDLWRGWPYAISLILILGTHELGHYFAGRWHKVQVTLPYFIPMPIGIFGTLGAFIQLREPMRNRKVLFDVGVAGPLAGLIVALPILFIGLATSHIQPLPKDEAYSVEGNSLLYVSAKYAVFGKLLPNDTEDVFVNQVAIAGWTGLFITGLNLIPLGQLDGGHIASTLLGKHAKTLYLPVISMFVMLALLNQVWLMWTLILLFLGRVHAAPLDSVTPLDRRRRWIGYAALLIFVLVFVPNPLQTFQP
jgi:Zn-dependent protease